MTETEPSTARPAWHARTTDETAAELGVDAARGLTSAEAATRLAQYGPNALAPAEGRSAIKTLAHQFAGLTVWMLLAASAIAFVLGDVAEGVAVLTVLALNAAIGFATEWRAAGALAGLRSQAVPVARVRRDGAEREVPAADVVPGDVVLLASGEHVPADARVAQAARLQVDEAALTGESLPVAKTAEAVADEQAALGDRSSMVHSGTVVTHGSGEAVVTGTGAATEAGHIGALLDGVAAQRTPLEAKLAQLSRVLLALVLVLCAVIVLAGWLRGNDLLSMVEVGVSLAIAAVPEGLLAVTTMTLALGMQRMARMNALVRRLPAVEALGSTTVICSDKTGTLTRNEMTVREMSVGGREVAVTGTGYAPDGEFQTGGQRVDVAADPADPLVLALRIGMLCNDATLDRSGGQTAVLGDPTEAALVVVAEKAGLDRAALDRAYPRVREVPFDSVTKRMTTVHTAPGGGLVAYTKGSPEELLAASGWEVEGGARTPLSDEGRARWTQTNDRLAGEALRVLALAYRDLPSGDGQPEGDPDRDLTFVGLVGMTDPLRDGVRDTVATCRAAGIRVVLITGDQEATAAEIARQLGLDTGPDGAPLRVVHARDLDGLDEAGWNAIVEETAVFARVSPEHKLRIVEALQSRGQIVAMTGDGANDAPALKTADIGIAMGIRGTDVAKDAADIVITDDNFATIVGAVEQGRVIVHNILRFIHYLFSCNFAEILTVFVAILIGWPLPLAVLQILWLNIVTDTLPALALALEPSVPGVMDRPPRDPKEPLVTRSFGGLIAWQGALLAACTLAAFWTAMDRYGADGVGLAHAVTVTFMTLAMAQVAHTFSVRSETRSAFTAGLFSNPWLWGAVAACGLLQAAAVYTPFLRGVLGTVPLNAADWGIVAAGALVPVAVVEAVKAVRRARAGRPGSGVAPAPAP